MSYLGRSAKLSLKAQEKVSFLATAGQTSKTGLSYTPTFIEVYVNGVLLTDNSDYTATNGNSITFTVALLLNDEVTVISLKTFTVADHYSKTEADALLAAKLPLAGGTMTGDTLHGDNVKAKFGTGNDLEIFHDGTHSYIKDVGTGDLTFSGDANISFLNAALNEYKAQFITNGAVNLYHDNAAKFSTMNDGIVVTGRVQASGNISTSAAGVSKWYAPSNSGNPEFYLGASDAERLGIQTVFDGGTQNLNSVSFFTQTASGASNKGLMNFSVDGDLRLQINDAGLAVTGGIALGGTGVDNTISDYETGTWTPTCSVGTVTNTESHYTKVGRVVHVTTRLSSFSNSSGSGQIVISGLPFTCAKDNTNTGFGWGNFTLRTVYAYGASGDPSITLYSGGAGYGSTLYSDIGSSDLILKLEYITNS